MRVDQVGGQHQAHGRTAAGLDGVFNRCLDLWHCDCRQRQVLAHIEGGVGDLGTGHGGLGLGQAVRSDQGVEAGRKDVLRLPAHTVEGQHHAGGHAAALCTGRVFSLDGGAVFSLHSQATTHGGLAVAQGSTRVDQDPVGGNQAIGCDGGCTSCALAFRALAFGCGLGCCPLFVRGFAVRRSSHHFTTQSGFNLGRSDRQH